MPMLKSIVLTDYQSNCYLLESGGRALLIDPGEPGEALRTLINGLHIEWIINTHAHPDHIGGDFFMAQVTGAPILIHQADLELFQHMVGARHALPLLKFITEGQTITVGDVRLDVLHTPGHSPGSVTLRWEAEKSLFTGDLLFAGSIGRTDFPGGSDTEMRQSLRRVAMLPEDWRLYPGHGPETSLERERRENPFLVGLL
jgi:glyoxylase-like metal-dependent hydrolase (beta-lactamase superfamily II)